MAKNGRSGDDFMIVLLSMVSSHMAAREITAPLCRSCNAMVIASPMIGAIIA